MEKTLYIVHIFVNRITSRVRPYERWDLGNCKS